MVIYRSEEEVKSIDNSVVGHGLYYIDPDKKILFWISNKENNFPICTLIWRPAKQ